MQGNEKMRTGKIDWVILIVCLLFGIGAFIIYYTPKMHLNKAEKFMKAGMYKQATTLLEQEVNAKPTNAKAHFLLGKCRLALGETESAEESFANATRLNSVLGRDIGSAIMDVGRDAVKILTVESEETQQRTSYLLELAVKYNPAFKDEAGKLSLELAKKLSDDNQINHSLQLAVQYNPANSRAAAEILLANCQKYFEREEYDRGLDIITFAVKYDPAIKTEAGKLFLDQARKSNDNYQRNRFLELAVQYDKTNNRPAAEILLANAQKYFESGEYQEGLDMVSLARKFDQGIDKTAGEVFFIALKGLKEDAPPDLSDTLIAECLKASPDSANKVQEYILLKENTPPEQIKTLIAECLKISPGSINKVQEYTLTSARNFLQQNKPALAIARLEIMIDIGINNQEIKNLFVKCSNELIENEPNDFRKGMELLFKAYPEITQSEDLRTKYLYGAYLWMFGSKNQAVAIFRDLKGRVSLPCIDFASSSIPAGKYAVYREFKSDEYWTPASFTFSLSSIEVTSDKILVDVTVRNHTKGTQTFFIPITERERKIHADELEKSVFYGRKGANDLRAKDNDFYLLDEFGNKVFPKNLMPFFAKDCPITKRTEQTPSCWRADIAPGQEWNEKLVFPTLSMGSSSFTFVLAEIGGTRPLVKFENIVLRKVALTKFPVGQTTSDNIER